MQIKNRSKENRDPKVKENIKKTQVAQKPIVSTVLPVPESLSWTSLPKTQSGLLKVEKLDNSYLPSSFYRYAEDQSHRFDNAPIEFVAIGILVAQAALLGNSVKICPKRNDKSWTETANLWGAIVGSPSKKKTPSLKSGIAPLRRLKSVFNDGSFDFVINDATYEAACIKAEENPKGILLFRDEISAWLSMLEKPEKAQERAFYLEGFSGGMYEQIRVTREHVKIENLTISVLGGLQPSKLLKMLRSREDGTNDDGLFERFQLLVFPDHAGKYVDKRPDEDAVAKINRVFESLSELTRGDSPILFSFTDEAQSLWDSWALKFKQEEEVLGEEEQTIKGKHPGLCAKLSLLFELATQAQQVQHDENFMIEQTVTTASLEMAIKWLKLLWSHNRRIHCYAQQNKYEDKTELLLKRLKHVTNEPFSGRDVYHGGPRSLRSASEFEKAANKLIELGYLQKFETKSANNKKKAWYFRHPSLISIKASQSSDCDSV